MPRYFTSTLAACALAATVNVFAQEPAPAPQPAPAQQPAPAAQPAPAPQPAPAQQSAPAQPEQQPVPKETLSGCVIEAKTTTGATAYVLKNAEGGSATMYVLAGSSQTDWATNVNKKVEVTGPVQQPNAPPTAEGAAAGTPKALRPPVIQVESVKVTTETCK